MSAIKTAVEITGHSHQTMRALAERLNRLRTRQARQGIAPVVARIEHGRWIAECPCRGGMAVDPAWASAFCLACGTEHTVTFPATGVLKQIEAVLSKRSDELTRNWFPHESVTDLKRENAAHGLKDKE